MLETRKAMISETGFTLLPTPNADSRTRPNHHLQTDQKWALLLLLLDGSPHTDVDLPFAL